MGSALIVAYSGSYAKAIRTIRYEVFTKEQGIESVMDFDGRDEGAIHCLVEHDGKYIGTGRMLSDGHIGRLAVLKGNRSNGYGTTILKTLIAEAKKKNLKRVFLGAQESAIGFYEHLGFSVYGDPFIEVGIKHVPMQKYV